MNTIFIGIAGGTGSGKTTLTEHLVTRFGDEIAVHAEITVLPGESGHADTAGQLRWLQTTHVCRWQKWQWKKPEWVS